jgi:hypothetical protein
VLVVYIRDTRTGRATVRLPSNARCVSHNTPRHSAEAVALLTYVPEVSSSNFDHDTDYPD